MEKTKRWRYAINDHYAHLSDGMDNIPPAHLSLCFLYVCTKCCCLISTPQTRCIIYVLFFFFERMFLLLVLVYSYTLKSTEEVKCSTQYKDNMSFLRLDQFSIFLFECIVPIFRHSNTTTYTYITSLVGITHCAFF